MVAERVAPVRAQSSNLPGTMTSANDPTARARTAQDGATPVADPPSPPPAPPPATEKGKGKGKSRGQGGGVHAEYPMPQTPPEARGGRASGDTPPAKRLDAGRQWEAPVVGEALTHDQLVARVMALEGHYEQSMGLV